MKKYLTIIFLFLFVGQLHAGPQTASSTTGTNLIAQARVYLDEPASSIVQWTEAELLQFLNDGMTDIASRTKCYQATESITLVANTIEYTPLTNYIDVIAVHLVEAGGNVKALVHGNVSSVGRVTSQGSSTSAVTPRPAYWYEFNGKIGIYPAYTAVTTQTVTVYFAEKPATIVAGGNVLTPAYLDRALVYYITAQAFMLDKRIMEANNYLMLYHTELERYRKDFIGVDNESADPIR